jgi:hypothetical protein
LPAWLLRSWPYSDFQRIKLEKCSPRCQADADAAGRPGSAGATAEYTKTPEQYTGVLAQCRREPSPDFPGPDRLAQFYETLTSSRSPLFLPVPLNTPRRAYEPPLNHRLLRAPGGPTRLSTKRTGEWGPVKPKLVVEVRYDQRHRRPLPSWHEALRFRRTRLHGNALSSRCAGAQGRNRTTDTRIFSSRRVISR